MTTTTTTAPQVATVYVTALSPEVNEAEMDVNGGTVRMQFEAGSTTRRAAARMLICGVLGLDADELAEDELSARPLDGGTTRFTAFI